MKDFYYYSFLKQNNKIDKEILDLIKYDLDKKIFSYGNQFKKSYENFSKLKFIFNLFIKIILSVKYSKKNRIKNGVLFNAPFYLSHQFTENGYYLITPEFYFGRKLKFLGTIKTLIKLELIKYHFINGDMYYLLSDSFINRILSLKKDFKKYIINNEIKALFLSNDMAFLEKLFISIFKDLNLPTFVFLHGIPTAYNNIDNNRADYLVVWSDKIKNTYINTGVDKEKIIVSGNPIYSSKIINSLSFSLNNLLIISHSITQSPENSDKFILQERGALLTYLYSIQKVLSNFGVKSVSFRPHPSENPKWYLKNLDKKFYKLDTQPINISINASSMVIGPISTVFFDALASGKNYIVYEPLVNNRSIKNFELVSPFNGTDNRIPVANSEDQLLEYIKNKIVVHKDVFKEYTGPNFSFKEVYKIIEKY
jgi:hypothetical protein